MLKNAKTKKEMRLWESAAIHLNCLKTGLFFKLTFKGLY